MSPRRGRGRPRLLSPLARIATSIPITHPPAAGLASVLHSPVCSTSRGKAAASSPASSFRRRTRWLIPLYRRKVIFNAARALGEPPRSAPRRASRRRRTDPARFIHEAPMLQPGISRRKLAARPRCVLRRHPDVRLNDCKPVGRRPGPDRGRYDSSIDGRAYCSISSRTPTLSRDRRFMTR